MISSTERADASSSVICLVADAVPSVNILDVTLLTGFLINPICLKSLSVGKSLPPDVSPNSNLEFTIT